MQFDEDVGSNVIAVASRLQEHAWATRTPPEPESVVPGLWAIALPAEDNNPIAYTLDYVLAVPEGIVLLDTGWGTPASHLALSEQLAKIGYRISDVIAVLVTHMHPDHFGLVPAVLEESPRAKLYMHDRDLALVDHHSDEMRVRGHAAWLQLMESIGGPDYLEMTKRPRVTTRISKDLGNRVVCLDDGVVTNFGPWQLTALWTPGHTPGHLCFLLQDYGLLFSGDHILPTITPQVAQLTNPGIDVLGAYLGSLEKLRNFEVAEVLPAHQYRFNGLVARIDELVAHHDNRFRLLEAAVIQQPGASCFELAGTLDWRDSLQSMPRLQARMAVKETMAHLMHLRETDRLEEEAGAPSRWWPVAS